MFDHLEKVRFSVGNTNVTKSKLLKKNFLSIM